jgi:hypothetical protein
MPGIISEMDAAIFTVRDLNRHSARVLATCDRLGSVRIRSRNGRIYSLQREDRPNQPAPLPDFAARRRAAKLKSMTPRESEALDKLMAGE